MNKARITYRFDEFGNQVAKPEKQETHNTEQTPPLLSDGLFSQTFEEDTIHSGLSAQHAREQGQTPDSAKADNGTPGSGERGGRVIDLHPLNPFTTDYGAWNSAFDEETFRVEQIIRQSGEGSGRFPPHKRGASGISAGGLDSDDDTDDPEIRETGYDRGYVRNVGVPVSGVRVNNRYKAPWLKLFASAAGAVVTGVFIGYLVLSLFGDGGSSGRLEANQPKDPGIEAGISNQSPSTQPSSGNAPNTAVSGPDSSLAPVAVNLAAGQFTILQNGVFSSLAGAETAASELRQSGFAAYVHEEAGKYYVYAGIAWKHDDALALSQLFQERNAELYLKNITVPAAANIRWAGADPGQAAAYFTQGRGLAEEISRFTVQALKAESSAEANESAMQAIRTAHMNWTQTSAKFGEGLAQDQQAIAQKMNTSLHTAVQSMEEYRKNDSAAYLWQAQSALMQYAVNEKALLDAIREAG